MKRILIVDNDHGILEVMQEALHYEGFDVITALDTDDIVTLVKSHQPDLLLIDYILNGVNGGELCHLIKKEPHTSKLPVIIISAYPRVLKSLGYYGCNAFISKPFDLNELTGTITNLIEKPSTIYN